MSDLAYPKGTGEHIFTRNMRILNPKISIPSISFILTKDHASKRSTYVLFIYRLMFLSKSVEETIGELPGFAISKRKY